MNLLQYKILPDCKIEVPVKKVYDGDAGFDLYNASNETIIVPPKESVQIPSGIAVKIPDGHCGIIMGRSSTFKTRGILVVQGLIDSGYVGPLFTIAYNPCLNGEEKPVHINPMERISQLVVHKIPNLQPVLVETFVTTERSEKGFGSSGL